MDSDIRPFVLCAFITYKSKRIRTNCSRESILSNFLDGFRDIDIRRFISVKRLIRNRRDRLAAQLRRDGKASCRTGVAGNRRFVARYGVLEAVGLLNGADNICVQQRGIIIANVLLQRIPILLCAAVIYGCQSSTIVKSRIFNARHTLWNRYFRQAAAIRKSTLPNARHTLWNRYFRQASVIRKSKFPNLRYRFTAQLGGNVHLAVRAEITNKGRRVIRSLINHIAGQAALVYSNPKIIIIWLYCIVTFLDSDIRPFLPCAFITYKSNPAICFLLTNRIQESILSNCLDGFGDINIAHFPISVKCLIRNRRDRLAAQLRRDDNVLRRTGVAGNRRFVTRYGVCKAVGLLNGADNFCLQQRVIITANRNLTPVCLRAAVIYGFQSITVVKSRISNARHALWNRHFRQAAATRKSSISNARHTFRNRYFRQAAAKCKSKYPNLRYRLAAQLRRDDKALRRTGVAGNRRFVARYGVFKAVFRVGCLLFVVRVVLCVDLCAVRQRCSLCAAHGTIHVAGFLRTRRGAGTRGRLHVGLCLCRQRRCHHTQRHGQRK